MDPLPKLQPPAPGRGERRFALAALAAVALALGAVLAAGVVVDPRNQFGARAGAFEPLVPDWPAEKLALFEAVAPPPATVVLGTSRGMAIPGGFNLAFPGEEVVNVGPLYAHLAAEGKRPAHIVYAVDQWALRDHREDRVAASSARAALGEPAPGLGERVADLAGTLSASYLRDVARSVGYAFGPGYPEPAMRFAPHGLLVYPAFEARATFDQDAALRASLPTLEGVFGAGRSVDRVAVRALGAFLDAAVANGTRVQVVLPPLHPAALALLADKPRFLAFTGTLRDTLVAHCGPLVEVYDATDPASVGADPADFYDASHGYRDTGRRLADLLAAGRGNLCG